MTFDEFKGRGFLTEISNLFSAKEQAVHCLITLGYPRERIPEFNAADIFWARVAREIECGIFPNDDLRSLIQHAADQYPGNPLLERYTVSRKSETVHGATWSPEENQTGGVEQELTVAGSHSKADWGPTESRPWR